METQKCIVEYQGLENSKEKETLYKEKIHPAFEKLTESLIFVYGFNSGSSQVENIKIDCVSFLYETIHKWDESRGTKAFSYFNVVAKNWLIINSRNYKKRMIRNVSLSDVESLSKKDKSLIAHSQLVESPEKMLMDSNKRNEIVEVLKIIRGRLTKENDVLCIEAITTVFEKIDHNSSRNKIQIETTIQELMTYIKDANSAVQLFPMIAQFMEANIRNDVEGIVEVKGLMNEIRSAWNMVPELLEDPNISVAS